MDGVPDCVFKGLRSCVALSACCGSKALSFLTRCVTAASWNRTRRSKGRKITSHSSKISNIANGLFRTNFSVSHLLHWAFRFCRESSLFCRELSVCFTVKFLFLPKAFGFLLWGFCSHRKVFSFRPRFLCCRTDFYFALGSCVFAVSFLFSL